MKNAPEKFNSDSYPFPNFIYGLFGIFQRQITVVTT